MDVALTFAAMLAFVWGIKYIHTRKRQEERQMIHRERILAMEKGIPLPEFPIEEGLCEVHPPGDVEGQQEPVA